MNFDKRERLICRMLELFYAVNCSGFFDYIEIIGTSVRLLLFLLLIVDLIELNSLRRVVEIRGWLRLFLSIVSHDECLVLRYNHEQVRQPS